MAHFDDVIIPNTVRFGSSTAPRRLTQQVFTASGARKANQVWSEGLRRLRLGYVKGVADIYTVLAIWEAVEGPANTFLARDWNDWNTTAGRMEAGDESLVTAFDQPLENTVTGTFVGDGVTKTFQAVKRYTVGASAAHTRMLKKLQAGSLKAAVDGIEQTLGVDFTVDVTTGVFTFTTAPGASVSPTAVAVNWGGAFTVPVHFAEDDGLIQELRSGVTSGINQLELLEARL